MRRIACIGNSHLAAFKLGWEQISKHYPGLTLNFFGAPATAMRLLKVEGQRLVPTSDATRKGLRDTSGQEFIGNDYDAYILVGMGLGVVHIVNMLAHHRPPNLFKAGGNFHLISADLVLEARQHLVDRSSMVLNIERVRSINKNSPIYIVPNPVPTTAVLNLEDFQCWSDEDVLEDCQAYLDTAIERYCAGARYFPQPRTTLHSRYLTKPEFSRGAMLLKNTGTRPVNTDDCWHLNTDYGSLFLTTIMSELHREIGGTGLG